MRIVSEKRGDGKYWVIISLILGILVLTISLYFIFKEYFDENTTNYETCRQSVMLRSALVVDSSGILKNYIDSQLLSSFPFKCKNEIIIINYNDTLKASKEIADAIASCYYLYGENDIFLYPKNIFKGETKCFVCSRIHFTPEVQNYYTNFKFGEYLTKMMFNKQQTFFDYIHSNSYKNSTNIETQIKTDKIATITVSNFNVRKGDILITYQYDQGAIYNGATSNYAVVRWGQVGYSSAKQTKHFMENCDIIETIPA